MNIWKKFLSLWDAPEITEEDTMLSAIQRGECPDCGGRKFYEGPSGGISVNYECANEACGSHWNVGFVFGGQPLFIERI